MNRTILYWLNGSNVILISGLIHFNPAPDEFQDTLYRGTFFNIHSLGVILSTFGISWGRKLWGRALWGVLPAGTIVSYLVSRAVNLPSGIFHAQFHPPLIYEQPMPREIYPS